MYFKKEKKVLLQNTSRCLKLKKVKLSTSCVNPSTFIKSYLYFSMYLSIPPPTHTLSLLILFVNYPVKTKWNNSDMLDSQDEESLSPLKWAELVQHYLSALWAEK